MPVVEGPADRIGHFECDGNGDGYLRIDLSAFNWNWKRRSGCLTDPVLVREGLPPARIAVRRVFDELPAKTGRILHSKLCRLLESDPTEVKANFIRWLQQSITLPVGEHPSDRVCWQILEEFKEAKVDDFLAEDKPEADTARYRHPLRAGRRQG